MTIFQQLLMKLKRFYNKPDDYEEVHLSLTLMEEMYEQPVPEKYEANTNELCIANVLF